MADVRDDPASAEHASTVLPDDTDGGLARIEGAKREAVEAVQAIRESLQARARHLIDVRTDLTRELDRLEEDRQELEAKRLEVEARANEPLDAGTFEQR